MDIERGVRAGSHFAVVFYKAWRGVTYFVWTNDENTLGM